MNAVVLERAETLTPMQVPRPGLTAPEHVLIEVGACGICGSDLRYYKGENPWALHTLGRHIDNPPNIIMGHEYAGTVVEVNSEAHEHLLGKRVGAQAFRVCGDCEFCSSGRENLCPDTIHLGHAQGWGTMDFYPGAYGEYTIAWGDLCYPMPDTVGSAETFTTGLDLLQPSGTFVNLAVHETRATLNLAAIGTERRVTTSSNAFNRDVQEAYDLLFEEKVDVKPWITHRFNLDACQAAFDLLMGDEQEAFKAVLFSGAAGQVDAS